MVRMIQGKVRRLRHRGKGTMPLSFMKSVATSVAPPPLDTVELPKGYSPKKCQRRPMKRNGEVTAL